MQPIQELKNTWQSIPPEVQQFLKRALLVFIVWKLIYHLFLFNGRIIDKPLTDLSTLGAVKIVQLFNPGSRVEMRVECASAIDNPTELSFADYILLNGRKIVGVADPCNALELMVLYLGFLIAFPTSIQRVLSFAAIGITAIYLSNCIRLAALAFMNMHRMSAVDMAHHYVFKLIVYALIFGLWVLFTKKQMKHDATF